MRRIGLVALFYCLVLQAHEIGTSRVAVLLHEDSQTYEVELVTDATALAEKLEASAGKQLPATIQADRLESLLESFDESFRQRVHIAFDASEVRPAITYSVSPALDASSAPAAVIRFTGQIPPDAHRISWTFGWTFASYPLTIR